MTQAMRVAVAGASGFIGSAVMRYLIERKVEVVGFGRRQNFELVPGSLPQHALYFPWDLTDSPYRLDVPTFRGRVPDVVVNAAGLADDAAAPDELERVNVAGALKLARAFPDARLVHISSSSVYDLRHASVDVAENKGPTDSPFGHYAASKCTVENELARLRRTGREVVMLRPHAVYGPGDRTLLPRLLEASKRGLPLPDGGRVPHMLTHVENLAHAVHLSLRGPVGTYNVTDPEPVLLRDAIEYVGYLKGITPRIIDVPYPILDGAARLSELRARWGGRPRLTRYLVAQLGRERTYDLTAAQTRLGYEPFPTDLTRI